MSVSASISLRVVNTTTGVTITPTRTLEILTSNHGWSLINKNGYAYYLLLGDDDMFDWTSRKMYLPSLMNVVKQKEQRGELVGVSMYWQNTYIGGSVLLWGNKEALQKSIRTPMSFSLSSDRKILIDDGNGKITDVNWYLTKLLPIFNQNDTFVEYFTYEEHI